VTELDADLAALLHWEAGPAKAPWVADFVAVIAALRGEGKTDIAVMQAIAHEADEELVRFLGSAETELQPNERAALINELWHDTQTRVWRLPEPRRLTVLAALSADPRRLGPAAAAFIVWCQTFEGRPPPTVRQGDVWAIENACDRGIVRELIRQNFPSRRGRRVTRN